MLLSVLMDDTTSGPAFACEHGLSLHIACRDHSILFDAGTSGRFLENAAALGLDLAAVDLAILSHGHVDHGGGLPAFLAVNKTAPVYVQAGALTPHFTRRASGALEDIGLPTSLAGEPRLVPVSGDRKLDDGLWLFSSLSGCRLCPDTSGYLSGEGGQPQTDPFLHEQNLLLAEGDRRVLLTGCSHRGILNILDRAMELSGRPMDAVVGGFHLSNPRDGGNASGDTLDAIGDALAAWPTQYYTCHCTGSASFQRLQQKLPGRIHWIGAGSQFTL